MNAIAFRSFVLSFVFAVSLNACSSSSDPDPVEEIERIAVLYIGHGEPAVFENGDIPVSFPDGSDFGPHGVTIGVPVEYQHTEWAAAYEEIATAMTYIFGDINGNGAEHETGQPDSLNQSSMPTSSSATSHSKTTVRTMTRFVHMWRAWA